VNIDCHTHTNPFSSCSTLSPDELLDLACSCGLDGLVLTEHEIFWPEEHRRWLKKAYPELKIFRGVETAVGRLGHVVVIPSEPDEEILEINQPRKLFEYIKKSGSYAFVAHPFRFDRGFKKRNQDYSLPGVEVASFNMHDRDSVIKSLEFAREHNSAPITASDAHSPEGLGEYYLEFEVEVETQKDLITALEREQYRPVAPVLTRLGDCSP